MLIRSLGVVAGACQAQSTPAPPPSPYWCYMTSHGAFGPLDLWSFRSSDLPGLPHPHQIGFTASHAIDSLSLHSRPALNVIWRTHVYRHIEYYSYSFYSFISRGSSYLLRDGRPAEKLEIWDRGDGQACQHVITGAGAPRATSL